MKKLILITTPLLLASCTQVVPPLQPMPSQNTAVVSRTSHANLPAETGRAGQYLALPGQGAIDTDTAFEQQAAAYANQSAEAAATTLPPQGTPVNTPVASPTVPTGAGVIVSPTQTAAVVNPYAPVVPDNAALSNMAIQGVSNVAAGAAAISGANMPMSTGAVAPVVTGPVDYTLRITNATRGRVYVEAQDEAGEIYPCGFMTGSQTISSVKKQVNPIQGPITVVVRDPDKPDAPELRRYKVDPPHNYVGKTVEITIISGGYYQVSVDGKPYYITPTPVGKPDLGTHEPPAPAAPAAPADKPADSAAPVPAEPAPEPEPAGL